MNATTYRAAMVLSALLLMNAPAHAGSLQVSPVTLELQAPAAAATLTLRNGGNEPVNAQVRVYRWSQESGDDQLTPTDAVVASPPMAALQPGRDYTVRIIRLSGQPVTQPEAYRLIVDEIPNAHARQARSVALMLRYSIPVFFYSNYNADARLSWAVERYGGQSYLAATNAGDQHVRLANMTLREPSGKTVSLGKGLLGYVLGRSTMRWPLPRAVASSNIAISAVTNLGPIKASSSAGGSH